jgi:Transposase DDE domain group 1
MQFKHAPAAVSVVFDDPNLVSTAGLVPVMRLAMSAGLVELSQQRLTVPTDKGANAGAKVASLVAGMLAGADSIDDMNLLRYGGMGRVFGRVYAPSTLGSFLRELRFGQVRQLDAVASRVLVNLASRAPLLKVRAGERVLVDLDDTIIEVHGYKKQGAGFGYSGVRGLNALLATASTSQSAPVVSTSGCGKERPGPPKGAARIVGDALATLRRIGNTGGERPLLRADSAFYGHATIGTAIKAGADVSVTVRMDPAVKAAIATIAEDAWTMIEYPNAIRDETTGQWISKAEVAEIEFTTRGLHPPQAHRWIEAKADHYRIGVRRKARVPRVVRKVRLAAGPMSQPRAGRSSMSPSPTITLDRLVMGSTIRPAALASARSSSGS